MCRLFERIGRVAFWPFVPISNSHILLQVVWTVCKWIVRWRMLSQPSARSLEDVVQPSARSLADVVQPSARSLEDIVQPSARWLEDGEPAVCSVVGGC
jgi:hypothetical protein